MWRVQSANLSCIKLPFGGLAVGLPPTVELYCPSELGIVDSAVGDGPATSRGRMEWSASPCPTNHVLTFRLMKMLFPKMLAEVGGNGQCDDHTGHNGSRSNISLHIPPLEFSRGQQFAVLMVSLG